MTQVWRKLVEPFLRYSATDYNLKHLYLSPPSPPPPTLPKFNRVKAIKSDFAAFATLQPCNLVTLISLKFESQILQLSQPLHRSQPWYLLSLKVRFCNFCNLATLIPLKLCQKETFGTVSSDSIKYSLTSSFLWYTRHPSKPNITGFDALSINIKVMKRFSKWSKTRLGVMPHVK